MFYRSHMTSFCGCVRLVHFHRSTLMFWITNAVYCTVNTNTFGNKVLCSQFLSCAYHRRGYRDTAYTKILYKGEYYQYKDLTTFQRISCQHKKEHSSLNIRRSWCCHAHYQVLLHLCCRLVPPNLQWEQVDAHRGVGDQDEHREQQHDHDVRELLVQDAPQHLIR